MTLPLLIIGDPANGFVYVGPFNTNEDAIEYAEREAGSSYWWVADLVTPGD